MIHRAVGGGLTRAAVFGMSDGLTSNVLLVVGFAGSGVSGSVVRLAGLAGAVAGAVSMGAGEWVSVSAQNELVEREVEIERRELSRNPDAEQDELTGFYRAHGMTEPTARSAAAEVMRHPERALRVHAREELGVDHAELPSAWRAAAWSFACFVVGALLPVLPWLAGSGTAAIVSSVVIGALAAAVLGGVIGQLGERSRTRAVLRQVAILLVAGAVTWVIGRALGVTVT